MCPSTSASFKNGANAAACWRAATKPIAITKDCLPRRRLRLDATSTTLLIRAASFFSFGDCTNARRILSPISQASNSNGYQAGTPGTPAARRVLEDWEAILMEPAEAPDRRQRQLDLRTQEWALSHAECDALLQPESFLHQPLQAGLVEQIVGEFFVGEHSEGGAFGSGGQF